MIIIQAKMSSLLWLIVYEFYSYYQYSSQLLKDNLTASILVSYISSDEEMTQDNLHYSDSRSRLPSLKPCLVFLYGLAFHSSDTE